MESLSPKTFENAVIFFKQKSLSRVSPYLDPDSTLGELQIILKTSERCNLACPYCYYFNFGDNRFADRPPTLRKAVVPPLLAFLQKGVKDFAISKLSVTFHGGEPMLQTKKDFEFLCRSLRDGLDGLTKLEMSMQTNGTLITADWIRILDSYGVSLGISIDGPPEIHDAQRPDHQGRGSFSKIEMGIEKIRKTKVDSDSRAFGTLSVIDAQYPIEDVYNYLTKKLGIRSLGFLLPDRRVDHPFQPGESAELYGSQLIRLFEKWTSDDGIHVREIQKLLDFYQLYTEKKSTPETTVERQVIKKTHNEIIVIQSDGDLTMDDSLIPTGSWRLQAPVGNVKTHSLREFLSNDCFGELAFARSNVSAQCKACRWHFPCHGGALEDRFSEANGFDNPSAYCLGLKEFNKHVYDFLIANGYPTELAENKLSGKIISNQNIE